MKRFARVFLKTGGQQWVDYPLGDAPFIQFVLAVRMQGCVMPDPLVPMYVPIDSIFQIIEIGPQQVQSPLMQMTPGGTA